MKVVLLVFIVLLVLAPVVTSVSCYTGVAGLYATTTPCDVCTTVTTLGVTTKACGGTGTGSVTCANYPSVTCCSTDFCNGAKINSISVLMTTVAIMVGLLRTL